MSRPLAVEAAQVCFSYGDYPVLRGMDLNLEAGRFHGIVGPNGCGKTTLLDIISGNLKPESGGLKLMGREVENFSRMEMARLLALAPQEFAVNFPFSVLDVVLMGRHPHIPRFSDPRAEDLRQAGRAMEEMEVSHLADQSVTNLSGGEKQRVVLARTLAQDTGIILLDEPTSNLDVRHSYAALGAVEHRVRSGGCTVLAVLHDLGLAAAFCDHLTFVHHGRVYASGPTEKVLSSQSLSQVFGVDAKVDWSDFAQSWTIAFHKNGAQKCQDA